MGKRREGMSVGVREIRKVLEMASSWPGGSYLLSLKTEEREKAKREKERGKRQIIKQSHFCNKKCQGFTSVIPVHSNSVKTHPWQNFK